VKTAIKEVKIDVRIFDVWMCELVAVAVGSSSHKIWLFVKSK